MISDWLPSLGHAEQGAWYDFRAKKTWVTTTLFGSRAASWGVGFAVALSFKYVLLILARLALRFVQWKNEPSNRPADRQPLLARGEHHQQEYGTGRSTSPETTEHDTLREPYLIVEVLRSKSGRDLVKNHVYFLLDCLFGGDFRHRTRDFLIGFLLLVAMSGIVALGFFAPALVVVDHTSVLLASKDCGLWVFNSKDYGDDPMARDNQLDRDREARAGEYEKACYNSSDRRYPGLCGSFAEQDIPMLEPNRNAECPFNNDICVSKTGNLFLDTGYVDANVIGINVKRGKYRFRRSAICAPLKTDSYVNSTTENSITFYEYYYGNTTFYNFTFDSQGLPFNDVLAPGYDLFTLATSFDSHVDGWTPIPALKQSKDKIVTILFISPLHVLYDEPNSDPIFGASARVREDGSDCDSSPSRYGRNNPIYGVLACVDDYEVCSGADCWPMQDQDGAKYRSIIDPAFWHMHLALEHSTIHDATAMRLGNSLVAQRMLSGALSPGLKNDHWKTEVIHLFATSLSRVQFDAWSIASGEGHDVSTYHDTTPDIVKEGRLCGQFKFKSPEFATISLSALIVLVTMPLYTWMLHWKIVTVQHKVLCGLCRKRLGRCEKCELLARSETVDGEGANGANHDTNALENEDIVENSGRHNDDEEIVAEVLLVRPLSWILNRFPKE